MFPHSTLNLLAFPLLVNNPCGLKCRLWTMEPARVFYFDDVVILPNILIMSDGRRLADDGNSSIRAMKTSSSQKTYGDFHIQHHECHGRVGLYQTLFIKKTQDRNAFNANGCVRLVCPVNKKSLIHSKANDGKAKTPSVRMKNFYFDKLYSLYSRICWFARQVQI